jgi:UDP-N-acetylmuramate dehydrogenase
MSLLTEFADFARGQEPLAPYLALRIGGPAEVYATPRSRDDLRRLVQRCQETRVPCRLLGAGSNVLVRDEGVQGVVVRLVDPAFSRIDVQGRRVRAAAAATLSAVISAAARHALAGLETYVGMPGTIGGAVRTNTGSRAESILQWVRELEVLDPRGGIQIRHRGEWSVQPEGLELDDALILAVEFELDQDDPDAILKRMRRDWINRKAQQPMSFQAAARLFRDPRGGLAEQWIEQAGLKGTRVGKAELSDRHPNYVVAQPGATARDVLRLIDLVRGRVNERFGQMLQLHLEVW